MGEREELGFVAFVALEVYATDPRTTEGSRINYCGRAASNWSLFDFREEKGRGKTR